MPLQRYIISNRQTWKRSSNSSPWYMGRREGYPCSTVERVGIFRLFKRFIWPLDLHSSCSCRHPLQRVGSSGSHTVKSNTNKVRERAKEPPTNLGDPVPLAAITISQVVAQKKSVVWRPRSGYIARSLARKTEGGWDLMGPIRIHIPHSFFLSFFLSLSLSFDGPKSLYFLVHSLHHYSLSSSKYHVPKLKITKS